MAHYELIVIGAGPGGYEAALHAAKLGKKVAVVAHFFKADHTDSSFLKIVPNQSVQVNFAIKKSPISCVRRRGYGSDNQETPAPGEKFPYRSSFSITRR